MPLSKIQTDILRLLAAHRDPESYVGGSTPLNRTAPRFSGDIDVFHDREERVEQAALNDAAVLQTADYCVEWLRRLPTIFTAGVTKQGDGTRLEWVVDSDYRFFPTIPDDMFGYVLHPVDLAMNKAMAAAGRRRPPRTARHRRPRNHRSNNPPPGCGHLGRGRKVARFHARRTHR